MHDTEPVWAVKFVTDKYALSGLIFCVSDKPNACKKENGTQYTGYNNGFNIPGAFAAIHKTNSCIDETDNS